MGMGVERLEPIAVAGEAVASLSLNSAEVNLASPEALAAALRRAASFLCPTTPRALVRAVTEVLAGLPGFADDSESQVEALVQSLVSYGDLLELPVDDGERRRRHVFLGPPAYVRRATNAALLIGVRPEGAPLVGDELLGMIDHEGHARFIRSTSDAPIGDLLDSEGLIELHADQWLNAPRHSTPEELIAFYLSRLEAAGPSGDIEGVRVIDPTSRVTYYRGRWRMLKVRDAGLFVARRPQAFGADLWCFAEVLAGEVTSLIDLPLLSPLAPGADEAWRLQAALDAVAGRPQRVRVRVGAPPSLIDLFSPVPSWIQRRLDVVGTPVLGARGALLSYSLPSEDVAEEVRFLQAMMWLSAEGSGEGVDHDG
jgi:hypothetical protein